jgi:hypothetical protein
MKHAIVPLTVVAMCLALPSIAISQPHDSRDPHRDAREETRHPKGDPKGDPRGDPKGDPKGDPRGDPRGDPKGDPRGVPPHEASPGARPNRPEDPDNAARYEQHLRQDQDTARARRAALLKDDRRWEAERNVRAENHRREIAQQWVHVADRPAAKSELSVHADRMARLNRALDLAEASDAALVSRINNLIRRENARHARIMAEILGGTP